MLIVQQLSLQLVAVLHRSVMPLARRGDSELADQLHRASRSVALNISEGLGYGRSARQKHHFRVALGSGREAFTCLELLVATGVVDGGAEPVVAGAQRPGEQDALRADEVGA